MVNDKNYSYATVTEGNCTTYIPKEFYSYLVKSRFVIITLIKNKVFLFCFVKFELKWWLGAP